MQAIKSYSLTVLDMNWRNSEQTFKISQENVQRFEALV